jgi:two-component system, chemotaxis family, chemotaxis protein CheY
MAYNILVVDDSQTIRAVIAKTLRIAEVPVGKLWEAANGKEALEILRREWIDLVFADINMPVMNGMEMIEQMEAEGLMETVPVVIVSTEGSRTRIDTLTSKGVKAYLRKPFTPESLKEIVQEVLGASGG